MDPTNFLGRDLLTVLGEFRASEEIVEYSKIERDEFLKLPEQGFYLHSKDGVGKIFDCRIYFMNYEEYFASQDSTRGRFSEVNTIQELEKMLGAATRGIRSVKIPTRPPTLPGKEFIDGDYTITAFSENGEEITFLHVKIDLT